jgi:hemolysin activation/secretion protein
VPTLSALPVTLPREGAIDVELEQGVLVFRVSKGVQSRVEVLLDKHRTSSLTPAEEQELGQYEDIDDYLSYLNRLIRNLAEAQKEEG